MKIKILLISSIVGVLGMITITQGIPIEVVYTGDSCDCPKHLNYLVNVPPPPKPNEYKTSEYGYTLDVPVQAKAKVTYSFDFTVQEPKIPPPPKQEKWDLYAKVDRITAHKKDCYASTLPSNTCSCSRCACMHNKDKRYVSPEARALRNIRKFKHPNSISKNMLSTSHIMGIFLQPLDDQPQTLATKSRNKRDISRLFLRGRKTNNVKRQDRLVKQYNKRLHPRTENQPLFEETPKLSSSPTTTTPTRKRPFENLKNLLVFPRLRNKRDIKGEYDLIEKEREQLDLTLPEIIQYMPETLDPNFKRGQCQFSHLCELQEPQEQVPTMGNTITTNENDKETLDNIEDSTASNDDSTGDSENAISSAHTKRNVANFGINNNCEGLIYNSYNPQLANPIPTPDYANAPLPPVNHNYEGIPRPFGIDPAPQQYVGAPHVPPTIQTSPILGATYNPHFQQTTNAQLDQIIADIVNRHSDFIEASTHRGGALVDPTKEQEYQTKAFFKQLWDGHWQKWFAEDAVDYSYLPNYRAAAPGPAYYPQAY